MGAYAVFYSLRPLTFTDKLLAMYEILLLPIAFGAATLALCWKFRAPELFVAAGGGVIFVALTLYNVFAPYETVKVKTEGVENTYRILPTPEAHEQRVLIGRVSNYGAWVMTLGVLTFALRVNPQRKT